MAAEVSTIELREKLGELLDRVRLRQEQFVITRKGKPVAALVPVEKLEQLEDAARARLLEMFQALARRPSLSESAAMRLADEAKHATRSKRTRTRR